MKQLIVVISVLIVFSLNALACIGKQVNYDVNFSQEGDVVVPSVTVDGKTTEIYDDTGYISYYLTSVYLLKQKKEKIDAGQEASNINFMKDRLQVLKKNLIDAGVKHTVKTVDNILDILNSPQIDTKLLFQAQQAFSDSLLNEGISVMARTRPSGGKWSDQELKIHEIALPSTGVARSMGGCSSGFGSFNTKISGTKKAPLPGGFKVN